MDVLAGWLSLDLNRSFLPIESYVNAPKAFVSPFKDICSLKQQPIRTIEF